MVSKTAHDFFYVISNSYMNEKMFLLFTLYFFYISFEIPVIYPKEILSDQLSLISLSLILSSVC